MARKPHHISTPVPEDTPGDAARDKIRLRVRLAVERTPPGFLPPARRWRAGLGPFAAEPLEVEAEPWQAEAILADALLAAEPVDAPDGDPASEE